VPKVFLSHASIDKVAVRRLAEVLEENGIEVWLDEKDLRVGDSTTEGIQKAIADADYVAVWLTRSSVASGWVSLEWEGKLIQGIKGRQVTVLPLLAEDCDVPVFLQGKKYADFRSSFESGLEALLYAVTGTERSGVLRSDAGTISALVRSFLADLDGAQIPFPTLPTLKIVASLKAIPRSGKFLRLESMQPRIAVRSIFDHVLSTAHSADVLLPILQPKLSGADLVEVARVIAYHDVCEVILGDVPAYTGLTQSKRRRARVDAERLLAQLPKGAPERVSNEFIAMFLHPSERDSLTAVQRLLEGKSEVRRYFYAMDKLDPIVATWRYLHEFRGNPGFSIQEFLDRMKHFFENPKVREQVKESVTDARLEKLVKQLQDRDLARKYFRDARFFDTHTFAIPGAPLRTLVEGVTLQFALGRRAG
jgi:5'-deoxynucleotidase YfbR-like HD superfamily hydrolase